MCIAVSLDCDLALHLPLITVTVARGVELKQLAFQPVSAILFNATSSHQPNDTVRAFDFSPVNRSDTRLGASTLLYDIICSLHTSKRY